LKVEQRRREDAKMTQEVDVSLGSLHDLLRALPVFAVKPKPKLKMHLWNNDESSLDLRK
jgi:hypothetical protein